MQNFNFTTIKNKTEMNKIVNYINGELIAPVDNKYIDNYNPATGKVYSLIPDSNSKDVELAVSAAHAACESWSNTPKEERSRILVSISTKIIEQLDAFALAESIDNGKPLRLAKTVDIPRAESNIRFFATGILHFASEAHPNTEYINYTLRKPIGVVGCISPWNLPLYLFTWKIAPALAGVILATSFLVYCLNNNELSFGLNIILFNAACSGLTRPS
jgi:aminomuconate-semialdehyde/2-hydroxymuconate-6-semialdehyde dehydrogenase